MIWWLILAVLIAAPLVIEHRRRVMDDAARGSAKGQFVELSQGVTHFEWHGPPRGPVIVCIHGLTTPSFVWRGMTRSLAVAGFRVLTYDLYGRGYSSRPKGPQDRKFFLTQLTELLAREGVDDDLTVIGYSMGGAIATTFAATYPERMRQLVLLAPAGMRVVKGGLVGFVKRTPLVGDWITLALYPRLLRSGIRAERGIPGSVPSVGDLQEAEIEVKGFLPAVLASLRGILSEDLSADHRAIAAYGLPVLAIWGREDSVIPLSCIGTLAEWNRNAQQEVIDGAGHGLTYTHSDTVLRLMRGWMKMPQT
ncbi:putative alpha/beta hydrolase [Sulfitobacter noctilucicola]|uniref:Pimeloyl-ACP methyl ester carboxylesterase n=1 Tax=Sulfitobacter noctilucicola TaxID=1342301 RepID=A0A7W6M4V4_9RHOB|nr:alpha/beta hydrolase [Sulfitobacter noctilucicola]KIN63077.1 putative alpha/beta hydrolase [Sulfitobacter noctilucicola]MBB4172396.1 pimeloyl-ACP methyl ester carboxylesterase [Sulfitobacter noctilucicola]